MKLVVSIFFVISLMVSSINGQEKIDLLSAALDSIGFSHSDLGYQPKGYWSRFPGPIPYKLKSFDDLFAEPLKLFDYGRSFGDALRIYGNPNRWDSLDNNLYNLTYCLGVERKMGGFRTYGPNLIEAPQGDRPLVDAVERLFLSAGERTELISFGGRYDGADIMKDLAVQIKPLPFEARILLGRLVENIREVCYWRNLGIRNIPIEIQNRVFQIQDIADTQDDGTKYYPEIDDAAGLIDFESLFYGGLKAVAAAEQFENSWRKSQFEIPADYYLDFPTPYGRIVISGNEDNRIRGSNSLLIVDFGGDDNYLGSAGASSSPDNGVSILIDLGGNDSYSEETKIPSFGAGIMGIGLLYDAAGSDRYEGTVYSQGAGFFGLGVLFDKEGGDNYKAETSSQGCGYFGIGLCIDGSGNDEYYIWGHGQGLGGIGGGVGVMADYSGDDVYTAEPYSSVTDRGDYHSDNIINGNNAQGAGFGRRGDGSDGHSYAGGLGVIVDAFGDDQYISGNWSLGCGYWFATGICYDGEGNDLYKSVYFTQASGAHFCNAALIDEAGDDRHLLYETAGAALAFGWDFTNALFVDRQGNDEYSSKIISYGLAQKRSFALFFDMAGADNYKYGNGQPGFGAATYDNDFGTINSLRPYVYYAKSAGIFIDASGTDNYLTQLNEELFEAEKMKNNSVWYSPEPGTPNYGRNNVGIGVDNNNGFIPELEVFND